MSGQVRAAIPRRVREAILDNLCAYCEFATASEVDHIIPWSRGGSDEPDNLAPACRDCNAAKFNMTPEEWRAEREASGLRWPPENPMQWAFRMGQLSVRDPEAFNLEVRLGC